MKSFEIETKKTVLFYLHGLRGHAFSQKTALQHIARNIDISIISLELPGHGSEAVEANCMVPKYHKIVDMIVEEIKRQSSEVEQVFLMGYSFGGALMLLAAHRLQSDRDFNAKILGFVGLSTALHVGHNVPRWQLLLIELIAPLSRFLYRKIPDWSRLVTIREMNVDLISSDDKVKQSILDDDYVYKGRIPLNTSAQVYKAGQMAKQLMNQINMPILLIHSEDDEIALAPQQQDLPDKVQLKLFENLRHNCIDGTLREAVRARQEVRAFIQHKLLV